MKEAAITILETDFSPVTGLSLNDNWNIDVQRQIARSGLIGNALLLSMLMASGITHYDVSVSKFSDHFIEANALSLTIKRNFSVHLKIVSIKKGRPSICDEIEV